jgi:large repetitive protein
MHRIPRTADTLHMTRIPATIARLAAVLVVSTLVPLALATPAFAARQKTIRINDASVVEGDAGQKTMSFTISWTGSKGGAAPSVHYATADATAAAGADYTATSATVTLSNGSCRCATVSVPVLGDTMTEGTETFTVNLSAPVNATIADAQGVGTIYDNEGPPSFVVTDVTGPEATGSLSFGVLLTNANSSPVSVDYATTAGTATAGTDYTTVSGTLTFMPGQTSKSVPVTVADDAIAEDDEAFTLNLSNPTGGLAISDAQGIGTIQNDDADPTVSVAAASVDEGDLGTATLSVPVTLSGPSDREVDVDFATSDGTATAGTDYTAAAGTLVFAAGETSRRIDITVSGDFFDEGNETITVTLTAPFNADLGTDVATATITNDDAGPKLSLPDASVVEGNSGTTALTFTVNMTPASPIDVTVHFATSDGSAAAGSDYVAASGTLTIQAGQTTGSITVDVTGDTSYESDETLGLLLSSPVGAKIVSGLATGTITNDDRIPTAIKLKTVKGATVVKAKGTIQPAVSGMAIKVSMLKKVGAKYRLVASKTVNVKGLKDRNGDSIVDGAYLASFPRPASGSYRFVATYAGSALYAPIAKTLNVTL